MPSMMKKQTHNSPSENLPDTDHQNDPERSWARLYERIRLLALRKSLVMLDADESEAGEFDRSARFAHADECGGSRAQNETRRSQGMRNE